MVKVYKKVLNFVKRSTYESKVYKKYMTKRYDNIYQKALLGANAQNPKEFYEYYTNGRICNLIEQGKLEDAINKIEEMDYKKDFYKNVEIQNAIYVEENIKSILLKMLGSKHETNIVRFLRVFNYSPETYISSQEEIHNIIRESYLDFYVKLAKREYQWNDKKSNFIRSQLRIKKIKCKKVKKLNSPQGSHGGLFFHSYLTVLSNEYDKKNKEKGN